MHPSETKNMNRAERVQMSNRIRKPTKPSHTHGGHSQARAGWTCGDTAIQAEPTRSAALSRYRVTMPKGRVRYVRPSA